MLLPTWPAEVAESLSVRTRLSGVPELGPLVRRLFLVLSDSQEEIWQKKISAVSFLAWAGFRVFFRDTETDERSAEIPYFDVFVAQGNSNRLCSVKRCVCVYVDIPGCFSSTLER